MSNPGNKDTTQINYPGQQPDPMKSVINPPPPMYGTSPSMQCQYQPYAGSPEAISMQPQQTILITNVQPASERDYLGYSIFTLLCCFLPLGIAALVFFLIVAGLLYFAPKAQNPSPYAGSPEAILMQPQQTILITNVQSVNEPAYLGYSIFTLLCCCLPLGIAALIYSIKTQGANQQGNILSAKRYSRVALTLDHTALGLGIASIVLIIIINLLKK